MAIKVVCPSGMSGVIRPMKVSEGRKLTDRDLDRRGLIVESIINECWIETIDVGPYSFKEGANGKPVVEWHKVLQGDRVYLLFELGVVTYGERYDFHRNCRFCGRRFEWSINCDTDVTIYELSEASREKIRAGDNRFPYVCEHGDPKQKSQLWFKLITGADERVIQRVTEDSPEAIMEQSLSMRIVEIEGVAPGDKLDWIRELTFAEAFGLTEEFDEHDCGVESEILVACPRCNNEQETTIPFDQDFILRTGSRKRKRKSKRRRRRRSSRSTATRTG